MITSLYNVLRIITVEIQTKSHFNAGIILWILMKFTVLHNGLLKMYVQLSQTPNVDLPLAHLISKCFIDQLRKGEYQSIE